MARARESSRPNVATPVRQKITDPMPGPLGSSLWFWFRFGRYANGVLSQVGGGMIAAWMCLCGAAFFLPGLLLVPSDPGPLSLFTGPFLLQQLGVFAIGALLCPLLAAVLIFGCGAVLGNRIPFPHAFRIGLGTLVPLASLSFLLFLLGALLAGESYWRGYRSPLQELLEQALLPAGVFWTSLRAAQALVRSGNAPPLPTYCTLLTSGTILSALFFLPLETFRAAAPSFQETQDRALASYIRGDTGATLPSLSQHLLRLPRRAVTPKAELLSLRLELHAAGGRILEARADALRLQRLFPRSSAWNALARGLNLVLQERPDLGIKYLESALMMDPDLYPARRWLARLRIESHPAAAAEHARLAWQQRPNVLHLREWVNALYQQKLYPAIWTALLEADPDPEQWFALTLFQGGVAAHETGRPARARDLLRLARQRDPALLEQLPPSIPPSFLD